MSTVTGRVLWGENPNKNNSNSTRLSDSDYLRIKANGDYFFMPLEDSPMTWHEHWADAITPEGVKRKSFRCSMRNCTLCAEYEAAAKKPGIDKKVLDGMKAKQKWAIVGFLLAEGSEDLMGTQKGRPCIFEFGKQVYDGISSAMSGLKKVGAKLNGSVILINKDKDRGVKAMYTVNNVPVVRTLTSDQQAMFKAFMDKGIDLEKMYETPTNEMNLRRLGRSVGAAADTASAASETEKTPTSFDQGEEAW